MYTRINLIIKNNYIKSKQIQLNAIAKSVSTKKITYKLHGSKGEMTDEINQLIDQINNTTSAIGKLLSDTSKSVFNIPMMFEKADDDMSNIINKLG